MEGVGLFTIAKYRNCSATAIYIITDVIDKEGWHLGWDGNKIAKSIEKLVAIIDLFDNLHLEIINTTN